MGELYEVHRMLVLSTSHITLETADKLPRGHIDMESPEDVPEWGPSFARNEGWLFYIAPEKNWFDDRYGDAPKDLYAVLDFARQHECVWLMLDTDGPVVDALPHWEW